MNDHPAPSEPRTRLIWHCESNFITCANEHLLKLHRAGFRGDRRREWGHSFYACEICRPPTYMFVVLAALPSPMATCYAIDQDCYVAWTRETSPTTLTTPEMLYMLRSPDGRSLNPSWRPPR